MLLKESFSLQSLTTKTDLVRLELPVVLALDARFIVGNTPSIDVFASGQAELLDFAIPFVKGLEVGVDLEGKASLIIDFPTSSHWLLNVSATTESKNLLKAFVSVELGASNSGGLFGIESTDPLDLDPVRLLDNLASGPLSTIQTILDQFQISLPFSVGEFASEIKTLVDKILPYLRLAVTNPLEIVSRQVPTFLIVHLILNMLLLQLIHLLGLRFFKSSGLQSQCDFEFKHHSELSHSSISQWRYKDIPRPSSRCSDRVQIG